MKIIVAIILALMIIACERPDAPVKTVYNSNVLINSGFEEGVTSWKMHSNRAYGMWEGIGRQSNGSLRLIADKTSIVEAWQGTWLVHPGDKVVFSGWFKTGGAGIDKINNGAGLGWDLRKQGTHTIFYTMNGPATLSQNWTYVYTEQIIPCIGNKESEINKWFTSDGKSETSGGARAGVWNSEVIQQEYLGKELPYEMTLTSWVQIWHGDTAINANVDDLDLRIFPAAIAC